MDKMNLLNIITIISLFVSFFLAFFLLSIKTKYKISNILFAIFLIISAIDVSNPLFSSISDKPSNLGMFRFTLAFLQIPVFYLYVLSVCYSDFKLKPKHFVHCLAFLIVNLVLMPHFYLVNEDAKLDFIERGKSNVELQFNHLLFHIQAIAYFITLFLLLRKAKKLYLENYAGNNLNSYYWLFQFTVVLAILYTVALLKNIFKFSDYPEISEGIKIGTLVFQLFIVCWYLYKALNNPELFRNVDSKLKLVSDLVSEDKKSDAEVLSEKEYNQDLQKLNQYMIEKKPFLNASLTIQDVSKNIGIPVRDLSILINHQLEQHFYDFVNSYRIEYAMNILKDSTKKKVTILEILYESGFNSKSSFNTAFKKYTGSTPTSFRNSL